MFCNQCGTKIEADSKFCSSCGAKVTPPQSSVMTNNYDLRIWDKLSVDTDGKQTGGWVISIYSIRWPEDFYGMGALLEDKQIDLSEEEAKRLTLGLDPELGGDYTPDDDFFIDKTGFFDTYSDIPERVEDLLEALPEYETGEKPPNNFWG
jgi:hypothetical protein